ncbi:MAG: hypothetical protein M3032_12150 [Verrucomicrobiota bacterium]|nr:hypothetical protein [Verrucomicrobiota bacterium]
MKKIAVALLCTFAFVTWSNASELSDTDKQFLAGYEKVRAGLAADNLPDAKKAAAEMGDDGAALAKTDSLIMARKEFEKMSGRAIELTKGQSGYYRVNCPMVKKDWVQTSEKISNPYAGREMLTCGVVKK